MPAPRPDGLVDDFDTATLDAAVWLPHYLPAWSSKAATAATYELRDSCLRLSIPPAQGHWLPGEHTPPLRVSGVQSGNWSGPAGGTAGQQPWRDGATVREAQEPFWGWTPRFGRLELRARMLLTPRSMAAWWLVGQEDVPERCAEICVAEVFGDAVEPGVSAAVGMGLHRFRDPAGVEDFTAVRLPIDVARFHTYTVDWTAGRVDFLVDGAHVRSCAGPPTYPMQSMLAVFDFPDRSDGTDDDAVPELVVDWIRAVRT
ncbi:glycoside hydrolase family 16 protein [Dactylosporangium sp. NPDC049525]|uniref:glycoside hydrolase family 16 protein n=1 Tax=Dactylosporangium sp. NPDC049525 TaxID=3154730 RepID=UPI003426F5BC